MFLLPVEQEALIAEFSELLAGSHGEQVYQSFLERNPYFIPREFVQNHGVHLDLIFTKLSLASDYTTDFFFLSKSSADWNCVFVEIEKPTSKYFKNNNKFHSDFTHALSQIGRWRAWLSNDANKTHLINSILRPVRKPLEENKCHFNFVLVHGRREEYASSALRRSIIHAEERHDFKILSYDSLLNGIEHNHDTYIGVRKNEYIQIITNRFVSGQIFGIVDTNDIRISKMLLESIKESEGKWRKSWFYGSKTLDKILPQLITI